MPSVSLSLPTALAGPARTWVCLSCMFWVRSLFDWSISGLLTHLCITWQGKSEILQNYIYFKVQRWVWKWHMNALTDDDDDDDYDAFSCSALWFHIREWLLAYSVVIFTTISSRFPNGEIEPVRESNGWSAFGGWCGGWGPCLWGALAWRHIRMRTILWRRVWRACQ